MEHEKERGKRVRKEEKEEDEEEEQEEEEYQSFFYFHHGNKRSRHCIQSQGASLQPYDPFHFFRLSMQGFLPPTLRGLIGHSSRMPSSLPSA